MNVTLIGMGSGQPECLLCRIARELEGIDCRTATLPGMICKPWAMARKPFPTCSGIS